MVWRILRRHLKNVLAETDPAAAIDAEISAIIAEHIAVNHPGRECTEGPDGRCTSLPPNPHEQYRRIEDPSEASHPNPTIDGDWRQHQPRWVPTPDEDSEPRHVVGVCSCGQTFADSDDGIDGFDAHLTELGAPDYMQTYWQFWARYVEAPTAALSRDAVARELFDYTVVMHEASTVYSELAGLSKPNTAAHHIIDGAEQRFNEIHADNLLDGLLDQMDSDGDRQAVIDYANSLHETAYEEYQRGLELRAKYAAQHAQQSTT